MPPFAPPTPRNEQMEDLKYTTRERWRRRDKPITTEEQESRQNGTSRKEKENIPTLKYPGTSPTTTLKKASKTIPSTRIMKQETLSTQ